MKAQAGNKDQRWTGLRATSAMNRRRPKSKAVCFRCLLMCPAAVCEEAPCRLRTPFCVFARVCYVRADKQETLFFPLQFDEEFSARQEAQAESQKKEERIKELEEKIQTLESQVNPLQRKKQKETHWNDFAKIELPPLKDLPQFKFSCPPKITFYKKKSAWVSRSHVITVGVETFYFMRSGCGIYVWSISYASFFSRRQEVQI